MIDSLRDASTSMKEEKNECQRTIQALPTQPINVFHGLTDGNICLVTPTPTRSSPTFDAVTSKYVLFLKFWNSQHYHAH